MYLYVLYMLYRNSYKVYICINMICIYMYYICYIEIHIKYIYMYIYNMYLYVLYMLYNDCHEILKSQGRSAFAVFKASTARTFENVCRRGLLRSGTQDKF